jgi:hypothetical protein
MFLDCKVSQSVERRRVWIQDVVESHLHVWKDEMKIERVQIHSLQRTDVGMVESLAWR